MTGLMALWIIVTIFYYNANVKQKNKIYKNSHDKNYYKIKQAYSVNAIFLGKCLHMNYLNYSKLRFCIPSHVLTALNIEPQYEMYCGHNSQRLRLII